MLVQRLAAVDDAGSMFRVCLNLYIRIKNVTVRIMRTCCGIISAGSKIKKMGQIIGNDLDLNYILPIYKCRLWR